MTGTGGAVKTTHSPKATPRGLVSRADVYAQVPHPLFPYGPHPQLFPGTCWRESRMCARCLPTSADRWRHTPQGLSMTLATERSEAGQVRAAMIPGEVGYQ